jgi:oxalate decarboxylase/phosphoglucose isomerase-like protein (cupin superfamily)
MATIEQVPDDVEQGPTNYAVGTRLLGENDRVRAWEIKLEPGERCPFHCHRTSYYWISHTDGVARVTFTDGTSENYAHKAGEVTYIEVPRGERLVHDLTNVGGTPLSFTTVELLESDRLFWRPYEGDLEQ